jgi:hypothetical protein
MRPGDSRYSVHSVHGSSQHFVVTLHRMMRLQGV